MKRKRVYLSQILMIFTLILCSFYLVVSAQNYSEIVFDFDSQIPSLTLGQTTPLTLTKNGLEVTFSSLAPETFSIQSKDSLSVNLSLFTNNFLYHNRTVKDPLIMKFSRPITSITLDFATVEYPASGVDSSRIALNAYFNSTYPILQGTSEVRGTWIPGDSYPQGSISVASGGESIDIVKLDLLYGGPFETTDFYIDNIKVTLGNASPEPQGSISGIVWNDRNGDAEKEPAEFGISGWTIYLSGDKNASTITNIRGEYNFTGLPAGNYFVSAESKSGWSKTYPWGIEPYNITIVAGEASPDNYFGYRDTPIEPMGIINGYKWNDLDGDSVKEPNEPGLSGWIITLTGMENITVVTDNDGKYEFTNLPSGKYVISENDQQGWEQTYPGGDGTHIIYLGTNYISANNNFGNQLVELYIIGLPFTQFIIIILLVSAIGAVLYINRKRKLF